MAQFSVVFFDLDGTLLDNAACTASVMKVVLPELMPHLPEEDPRKVLVRFNAVLLEELPKRFLSGDMTMASIERFQRLLRTYRIDDARLARELGTLYDTTRRFRLRSFVRRGAFRVLEGLAERGIARGILANGPHARQRFVLHALGLEEQVEHVVIGDVERYSKPDPRLFHRAVQVAGADPRQTLYVGDNPITDLAGAARAGIPMAWLRTGGPDAPPMPKRVPEPAYVIEELSAVLAIVDGLR